MELYSNEIVEFEMLVEIFLEDGFVCGWVVCRGRQGSVGVLGGKK